MFTNSDAKSFYFLHDDALIMKLMTARCFVKRILGDTSNSMDIIFPSTLRKMKFDKGKIQKITLNLVGFDGEPSVVIGNVVMPVSSLGK